MVNNFLFNSNKKYKDSSVKSQRQLRVGEEFGSQPSDSNAGCHSPVVYDILLGDHLLLEYWFSLARKPVRDERYSSF